MIDKTCEFCGTLPNASDPTVCQSRDQASACAWAVGRLIPIPRRALDDEAANLDGMAEASRVIASKHLVLGDEIKAAYWRGRARGLQLAAHNLHLSPTMPLMDEGSS